jgi:hypothetical protein
MHEWQLSQLVHNQQWGQGYYVREDTTIQTRPRIFWTAGRQERGPEWFVHVPETTGGSLQWQLRYDHDQRMQQKGNEAIV